MAVKCQRLIAFQSTRPRGRTRRALEYYHEDSYVSIHASSREDATCYPLITGNESIVSIHASSREDATRKRTGFGTITGFNPRVLAGGRDLSSLAAERPRRCFNPRVLAGGRDKTNTMSRLCSLFQSTRPRGRTRHAVPSILSPHKSFQSTRPRGRTRRAAEKAV